MKLDIGAQLKNLSGEGMFVGKSQAESVPALLGDFCVTALVEEAQGEKANAKSYHRWNLAKRITKAMEEKEYSIELPVEDVTLIKQRIENFFHTKYIGPCFDAIEQSKGEKS